MVSVFFGLHMTGDPARIMLGNAADEVALEAFRAQWGLNLPLWQQFLTYFNGLLHGDFGTSISTKKPIFTEFFTLFPATLELSFCAVIFAVALGVPAGVIAAVKRNSCSAVFKRVKIHDPQHVQMCTVALGNFDGFF